MVNFEKVSSDSQPEKSEPFTAETIHELIVTKAIRGGSKTVSLKNRDVYIACEQIAARCDGLGGLYRSWNGPSKEEERLQYEVGTAIEWLRLRLPEYRVFYEEQVRLSREWAGRFGNEDAEFRENNEVFFRNARADLSAFENLLQAVDHARERGLPHNRDPMALSLKLSKREDLDLRLEQMISQFNDTLGLGGLASYRLIALISNNITGEPEIESKRQFASAVDKAKEDKRTLDSAAERVRKNLENKRAPERQQ